MFPFQTLIWLSCSFQGNEFFPEQLIGCFTVDSDCSLSASASVFTRFFDFCSEVDIHILHLNLRYSWTLQWLNISMLFIHAYICLNRWTQHLQASANWIQRSTRLPEISSNIFSFLTLLQKEAMCTRYYFTYFHISEPFKVKIPLPLNPKKVKQKSFINQTY